MIIGITGSRTYADPDTLAAAITRHNPTQIITGGAKGADALARAYARIYGIRLVEILPKFKTDPSIQYHPRWYLLRNEQIAASCDILLAFWDGKSRGTKYTVEFASKIGTPVEVVRF